jgi:hypothetical protein
VAERFDLRRGDSREVLRGLSEGSVDALVTDPPAGIGFMGKKWDEPGALVERSADTSVAWDRLGGNHHPANSQDKARTARSEGAKFRAGLRPIFEECLRVLKPGAHGLVWALPRTSHWTATALEDAGFEIRDRVSHLFGTGFPKSLNLDGGLGTALKPACEDWWLVRKPLEGTVAANVAAHGTGALNIDATRIGVSDEDREVLQRSGGWAKEGYKSPNAVTDFLSGTVLPGKHRDADYHPQGRWPANVTLDEEAAALLDEQSGESGGQAFRRSGGRDGGESLHSVGLAGTKNAPDNYGDTGGASRFFYVAKPDRASGTSAARIWPCVRRRGHRARRTAPPASRTHAPEQDATAARATSTPPSSRST